MTPLNFERMKDGYNRRNRQAGVYFRELYALHCNLNRKENTPPFKGTDFLSLPDDPPEPVIKYERKKVSKGKIERLYNRFNGIKTPPKEKPDTFSPEYLKSIYERFNPKKATA